jgi:hypothetical protein
LRGRRTGLRFPFPSGFRGCTIGRRSRALAGGTLPAIVTIRRDLLIGLGEPVTGLPRFHDRFLIALLPGRNSLRFVFGDGVLALLREVTLLIASVVFRFSWSGTDGYLRRGETVRRPRRRIGTGQQPPGHEPEEP